MAVDCGTARPTRRRAANGRTQGSRRGHRSATARVCIVLALAALSTASTSSIPLHACKPPRDLSAASTVPSAASVRLFLRGGSSSADAVWAAAVDAGSGRTYYYNVKTKEVAWALPPGATLRPPRTAGAGAGASAGTTAGGGGGSGATASAAGAVESGTAAQPASGGGQAQQAPLTHATAGSANDKGTQTGDDSLVTVHAPPVVAEVDPGFGRKPAEPAPAPDNTAAFNGQPLAAGAGNQGPAAGPGTAVPGGEVAAASPQPHAAVAQQTSSAATDAATAGAASTRPQLSSNSLWKEVLDPASGRVYYFHTITKESVWTMPNLTQVDLTEVEEKTSEEMRDEVRQHELVSMAESRYNDTAEAKAQIDEARAHYKDVKSGIADVRSADADLRAEANAATFTVTKFFTRLKNTAAVTSNFTSSIFRTVGGAASELVAAATRNTPTPAVYCRCRGVPGCRCYQFTRRPAHCAEDT
eukprot:Tamp_06324.p1 GENE.Tamp_06324~~Tamp_06324.p1  ORF type:complete len:484 (+),score=66.04 Tamp_06324:38-1453(+)